MKTIHEILDEEIFFEIALNDEELQELSDGNIIQSDVNTRDGLLQLSLRRISKREEKENAVKKR